MNPLMRFLNGFRHGYGVQRNKRLQREAQIRGIQAARRVESTVAPFTIGNRIMTATEINFELDRGAKFVVFQYCVSILVRTYKRPSKIYFLRPEDNALLKGLSFSVVSLLFGWWGFPYGPIWTIGTIATNFRGGKIITGEVVTSLNAGLSVRAQ